MELLIFLLVPLLGLFVLWLGTKILKKAGFEEKWVFMLLIPFVNIIMIWVFAFAKWPNLKEGISQDLD